jgi:hypothetical protein
MGYLHSLNKLASARFFPVSASSATIEADFIHAVGLSASLISLGANWSLEI